MRKTYVRSIAPGFEEKERVVSTLLGRLMLARIVVFGWVHGFINSTWLVYDLERKPGSAQYHLTPHTILYTEFGPALDTITKTEAGPVADFIKTLEKKLKKLKKGEPVADTSPDDAVAE